MKKIIGLVGETGFGNDAFGEYLKPNFKNIFIFRFSQSLTEALRIFFDEVKKEDQQWLAPALRKRFGNNVLGEAIKKKIRNIKRRIILLNGIWNDWQKVKRTENNPDKENPYKYTFVTLERKIKK